LTKLRETEIMGALSRVIDPDLNRDIVSLGLVENLVSERNRVRFDVAVVTPADQNAAIVKQRCIDEIRALGVDTVDVGLKARVHSIPVAEKQMVPGIRNIIAVASGKGGVGKSTIAINLALALAETGARTGLLDCDVYGPSVSAEVGIEAKPEIRDQKMVPHRVHGLSVMSMGFMVPRGQAIIWRGPMLHKVMTQFLFQVDWGGLDVLVLDLPPGTGDVQLTLAQSVPVSAAVLVTTPQEVALRDVEKGLRMFQSVKIPVLGIVENMSYYLCGKCEKKHAIFGQGGAQRIAKGFGIPVLGEIPLEPTIQGAPGQGRPILVRDPESSVAKAFRETARAVVLGAGRLVSDWASPGPRAMEV